MGKKATIKQIKAILSIIKNTKRTNKQAKKICFALIRASEKLTKPVYITTSSIRSAKSIKKLLNYPDYLNPNSVLTDMGSNFHFQVQVGTFSDIGQFQFNFHPGKKMALTIWLCEEWCDNNAIAVPLKNLEETNLNISLM